MKQVTKPFFNALHYPALMPYQKAESHLVHTRQPNEKLNQEVFYRLYDRQMVENQAKVAAREHSSKSNHQSSIHKGRVFALESVSGKEDFNPRLLSNSPASRLHPKEDQTSGLPSALTGKLTKSKPSAVSTSTRKSQGYKDSSYLVRERARLAMATDANKKFTWEHLEKMNINELKGITNINFDPNALIGYEDEEDRYYMQEYLKHSTVNRQAAEKQVKEKKNFESYGELRKAGSVEAGDSPTYKKNNQPAAQDKAALPPKPQKGKSSTFENMAGIRPVPE